MANEVVNPRTIRVTTTEKGSDDVLDTITRHYHKHDSWEISNDLGNAFRNATRNHTNITFEVYDCVENKVLYTTAINFAGVTTME